MTRHAPHRRRDAAAVGPSVATHNATAGRTGSSLGRRDYAVPHPGRYVRSVEVLDSDYRASISGAYFEPVASMLLEEGLRVNE